MPLAKQRAADHNESMMWFSSLRPLVLQSHLNAPRWPRVPTIWSKLPCRRTRPIAGWIGFWPGNFLPTAAPTCAAPSMPPRSKSTAAAPKQPIGCGRASASRSILPELPRDGPQPEDIPLDILYEDRWLAVINKPPGMVVHPGKGHWSGTLTARLQFHFDQLSGGGGPTRPGIVHRLDRDTSGVIVIAKNDQAHRRLAAQFEERTIEKEYFAIVAGRARSRSGLDRSADRPAPAAAREDGHPPRRPGQPARAELL